MGGRRRAKDEGRRTKDEGQRRRNARRNLGRITGLPGPDIFGGASAEKRRGAVRCGRAVSFPAPTARGGCHAVPCCAVRGCVGVGGCQGKYATQIPVAQAITSRDSGASTRMPKPQCTGVLRCAPLPKPHACPPTLYSALHCTARPGHWLRSMQPGRKKSTARENNNAVRYAEDYNISSCEQSKCIYLSNYKAQSPTPNAQTHPAPLASKRKCQT